MLSRRHLRIKVMQALYGLHQEENRATEKAEKELLRSVERTFDDYFLVFLLFIEMADFGRMQSEDAADLVSTKRLNTMKLGTRFYENRFVQRLIKSELLADAAKTRKLSWSSDRDFVERLFNAVRRTKEYIHFAELKESTWEDDRECCIQLLKKVIFNEEMFEHTMEEKSLYWGDDKDLVTSMVIKTFKGFDEEKFDESFQPLFKNEHDDTKMIFLK